jgi:hypothetical protein
MEAGHHLGSKECNRIDKIKGYSGFVAGNMFGFGIK